MVYLLVGVPASGKSWVCGQLKDKFNVIEHDAYIGQDYVAAIKAKLPSTKPVLIETPFSMSQIMEPLMKAGVRVEPVFLIEAAATLAERYAAREGKPYPKGHLTRANTYLQRARDGDYFYGSSENVLEHLLNIIPK